jgi:hypothetical protein
MRKSKATVLLRVYNPLLIGITSILLNQTRVRALVIKKRMKKLLLKMLLLQALDLKNSLTTWHESLLMNSLTDIVLLLITYQL